MRVLAVLVFLLGVLTLFRHRADVSHEDAMSHTVAMNFAIYRQEVLRHVYANRGISGEIPLAALDMPPGWQPLWHRTWRARVEGGRIYVYGNATLAEAGMVRDLYMGSFALGVADSGVLSPAPVNGAAVSLPGWIPNGNLVSVTGVD